MTYTGKRAIIVGFMDKHRMYGCLLDDFCCNKTCCDSNGMYSWLQSHHVIASIGWFPLLLLGKQHLSGFELILCEFRAWIHRLVCLQVEHIEADYRLCFFFEMIHGWDLYVYIYNICIEIYDYSCRYPAGLCCNNSLQLRRA